MALFDQFLVQFPEFDAADPGQVQAMLAAAALEIDREIWGVKADQGTMYLAAHKLALSPFGNGAQLVAEDGSTTYQVHYDRLVKQVGIGAMTV